MAQQAEEAVEELADEITQRIADEFEHLGFHTVGAWGEVVEVSVTDVRLGPTFVAKIDHRAITLEFDADVEFTAELVFGDPEKTTRDSETGDIYVFGEINQTVSDDAWIEGELVLQVRGSDASVAKLRSLYLNQSDVGISVDE